MSAILPGLADVHVDRPLTNISLAFQQEESRFIADRVFPRVSVSSKSDEYYRYARGEFNRDQMTERAPATESSGINFRVDTDNYSCKVWASHYDVADQVRANADSPINLDRDATIVLTEQFLIRKEKLWRDNFFATGIWSGDVDGVAGAPGANQFQQWDQSASTPIENIRLGAEEILRRTGRMPNKLVLGRTVYNRLLDHPDLVGRIDRGQTTGAALVMRQTLAALFEVDEVLVMDSSENTAAEGATAVQAFVGGKHALLLYAAPSPGLMTPSAGYTFAWSGLLGGGALGSRIKRFRMEPIAADRIELEAAFVHKLVSADLGYFFESAVA